MANIYKSFKEIQATKNTVYTKRSASFIVDGLISNEITLLKNSKIQEAALVFDHKEGPDNVLVYTLFNSTSPESELYKGDYFSWDGANFLVYEDVRLNDKTVPYKKQKAIECNVSFKYEGKSIMGAFISSMRRSVSLEILRNQVISDDQTPLLIIADNDIIDIGFKMKLGGRYWRVKDYDDISNQGIMYLYLEPTVLGPQYSEEKEEEEEENNIIGDNGEEGEEVEEGGETEIELEPEIDPIITINPLVTYSIETNGGYFAAVPKAQVIKRTATLVDFMVPLGVDSLIIQTKNGEGTIIETEYKVVM